MPNELTSDDSFDDALLPFFMALADAERVRFVGVIADELVLTVRSARVIWRRLR